MDEILSPSTVVVGGRWSSPSSVISTFSSKGGTFEKNQIFAVFQKLTIFLKSNIFSKNEWTRFYRRRQSSSVVAVVGRRRRPSSPSSVISTFSSKGGTFEKNQIFAVFQKLTIFLKSKIFSKMSGRDFIAVDSHRRSSPLSVVAIVRSSPSSVISIFRPREGPLKKIRFSLFFKNSQFF